MALSTLARLGGSARFIDSQFRILFVRCYSAAAHAPAAPKPPNISWKPPSSEVGFYDAERDYSRDSRYTNPQKKGDTAKRALFRKLGHAFEVYPIIALCGLWCILFSYTVYISFDKIEVWVDRSHKEPPWDWERVRNNYWKKHTLAFDFKGQTHSRLEIMEKLQDEMVAAAKKRGTR